MPKLYPFRRLHPSAADARRLCCVPGLFFSPVQRASYYNADPQNLVRCLDPRAAAPLSTEDVRPRLVKDHTPGLFLCETVGETGSAVWLAARLGEGDAVFSLTLPEVLCEPGEPIMVNHKPEPTAAQIALSLVRCIPPAAVLESGGLRCTVYPIHDPVTIQNLQLTLASARFFVPQGELPPAGQAVRILLWETGEAPRDFAAGLVMDEPEPVC